MSALKWPLTSVHSQMIKEIVPFAEDHLAPIEVAPKYFHEPVSLRIFIFEHLESFSRGYSLLNF